jgi:hypothetical protein
MLDGLAIRDLRKTHGERGWWSLHMDRYFNVAGGQRCLSGLKRPGHR